ncbi:YARHG domain-containing protein [Terrisporobacter sp.]|uniref:YARHG domain-containing protein n=1 Tax=Terrisporobacter sp. TaxID=1965305 RepID=UPI00260B6AF6|nr:YARHG domain-containing protein [Terrisporobacter sp.]
MNYTNIHDGYIFADSYCRYLTESDLVGLNEWELKVARNEIYARHGRLFKDTSLQNYFDSCYWYKGYISSENFNNDSLNDYEIYNIKLIKSYE